MQFNILHYKNSFDLCKRAKKPGCRTKQTTNERKIWVWQKTGLKLYNLTNVTFKFKAEMIFFLDAICDVDDGRTYSTLQHTIQDPRSNKQRSRQNIEFEKNSLKLHNLANFSFKPRQRWSSFRMQFVMLMMGERILHSNTP